jgi:hypothetical protein
MKLTGKQRKTVMTLCSNNKEVALVESAIDAIESFPGPQPSGDATLKEVREVLGEIRELTKVPVWIVTHPKPYGYVLHSGGVKLASSRIDTVLADLKAYRDSLTAKAPLLRKENR